MNMINPRLDHFMDVYAELHRLRSLVSLSSDSLSEQQQQQQPTRRVRFSPLIEEAPSPFPLTKDEIKDICWYNSKDLQNFKIQARQIIMICCGADHRDSHNNSNTNNQTTILSRDDMETLRGLEGCTFERNLHKHRSIRCTLLAIRRGMSEEEVAEIYKACTIWNVEMAVNQARHDYVNVYQPDLAHSVPRKSNIPPAFPFELKRVAENCTTTDDNNNNTNNNSTHGPRFRRRVRQRII